jgi:Zn-dependent protease
MLGFNDILSWSFPAIQTRRLTVRISWLLLVWMLFDAIRFAQTQHWPLVIAAGVVLPLAMLLNGLAQVWMTRRVHGTVSVMTLSVLVNQSDITLPVRPWPHLLVGLIGLTANLAVAGGSWWGQEVGAGMSRDLLAYVSGVNAMIGLVNLLACAPFDGQRWWRGLLWLFMPMAKAVRLSLVLGMVSAVFLIVVAAWLTSFLLLFCGIASLLATISHRQAVESGHDPIFQMDPAYGGSAPQSAWSRQRTARREEVRAREEAAEQEVLDRLLAKVSADGLPSLTAAERKQLQRISQRQKERAAEG